MIHWRDMMATFSLSSTYTPYFLSTYFSRLVYHPQIYWQYDFTITFDISTKTHRITGLVVVQRKSNSSYTQTLNS